MRTERPILRILRWAATALSLLILIAWMLTVPKPFGWMELEYHRARSMNVTLYNLKSGGIEWRSDFVGAARTGGGWNCFWYRKDLPRYDKYMFGMRWPSHVSYSKWSDAILVPLWLPFLILFTPAACLWYRALRGPPRGYCRECGYNLTGNISGVCPECGTSLTDRRDQFADQAG